jgi:hypothetical protein
MTDIGLMRKLVHRVCCSHGVSVVWLFSYGNFGQQMNKGTRLMRGDELMRYAGELIERYVGLGLDRNVLEDIRSSVFNVGRWQAVTPRAAIVTSGGPQLVTRNQ